MRGGAERGEKENERIMVCGRAWLWSLINRVREADETGPPLWKQLMATYSGKTDRVRHKKTANRYPEGRW